MTALVLINDPFQARVIVSRLQDLHGDVLRCASLKEAKRKFNNASMLFVCTSYNQLVCNIRQGNTSASPFLGISLLALDHDDYRDIGLNSTLVVPFSLNDIDLQYKTIKHPTTDFISIPNVYVGPERRVSKQMRPFDRRSKSHPEEKRFKPTVKNKKTEWHEIPNQAFINDLKNLLQLFHAGQKDKATPLLKDLLKRYAYPEQMVRQIFGDHFMSLVDA